MKYLYRIVFIIFFITVIVSASYSQCAVCTKTASQLGEKPAQGMNTAILYLMMMPFAIAGFIAYRWWKNNRD